MNRTVLYFLAAFAGLGLMLWGARVACRASDACPWTVLY